MKDALADRHNFTAEEIVSAFDSWLSARLAEAYVRGKDLCFYDREFTVVSGAEPVLDGWDYLLVEPGAVPPAGPAWTVYRLHGIGAPQSPNERRQVARA